MPSSNGEAWWENDIQSAGWPIQAKLANDSSPPLRFREVKGATSPGLSWARIRLSTEKRRQICRPPPPCSQCVYEVEVKRVQEADGRASKGRPCSRQIKTFWFRSVWPELYKELVSTKDLTERWFGQRWNMVPTVCRANKHNKLACVKKYISMKHKESIVYNNSTFQMEQQSLLLAPQCR